MKTNRHQPIQASPVAITEQEKTMLHQTNAECIFGLT